MFGVQAAKAALESNTSESLRRDLAELQEQYTTTKKMSEMEFRNSILSILLKLEKCSQLSSAELSLKDKIQKHGTVATSGSDISEATASIIQQYA